MQVLVALVALILNMSENKNKENIMSHYDDIRNQIHRQMVPLPILYRDDYSIDHAIKVA